MHQVAADTHPSVRALNFSRLRTKLEGRDDGFFDDLDLDLVEREYRRFLELRRAYPEAVLVPDKVVDEFWHAHILDTIAYHADCDRVFGRYLHHFPYFGLRGADDASALETAFASTRELYRRHFGEEPPIGLASRCGDDHVCHAPRDCACRTPSACK